MRTGSIEMLCWVTTHELAQLTGVHRTTATAWRTGAHRAPLAVIKLLEMYVGGHVGPLAGTAWHGWYFDREGLLCSTFSPPYRISAGELNAYLFLRTQGIAAESTAQLLGARR